MVDGTAATVPTRAAMVKERMVEKEEGTLRRARGSGQGAGSDDNASKRCGFGRDRHSGSVVGSVIGSGHRAAARGSNGGARGDSRSGHAATAATTGRRGRAPASHRKISALSLVLSEFLPLFRHSWPAEEGYMHL